ncbi:MAG: hypothetical protein E7612_03360 [Ruminococcaceae bacterium]|nr:hypothetical protein [Oscillospiraceae bacterium]
MTVKTFIERSGFYPTLLADEDREISGVYIGDLLSWVMGRAKADNAWITIMSNLNVIAVASLADISCVVFSEGVTPDEELVRVAAEKGVNLISTPLSSYEAAVKISEIL